MKKIILVLTAAVLAVTMCACGGNNNGGSTESTASSVSSAAPAASAELDLQKALEKVKAEIKMPATTSDYTAARLKRTFGLDEEKVAEFAGMFCDDGVTQDRIIYIKAKTEADVTFIHEKLKNDWEATYNVIKNYTPEQAAIIEKATVDTDGLYVSLVISGSADEIKKIFKETVKA